MPQQIHLAIPQPCHEDWQNMSTTQQGRFCNSCAKQVIDFTTMSDTEVLHYFLDKKNEKVCGRMYPDQLNRTVTKPVFPKKKKFWYWNYAAILLLFFSKSNGAKAQGKISVVTTETKTTDISRALTGFVGNVTRQTENVKTISGKISDNNGEPVSGASVIIKGTNKGVATDAEGNYTLKTNSQNAVLQISSVGFETKEVKLDGLTNYDVTLNLQLMGEVITVGAIVTSDGYYYNPPNPKHIAVLELKDNVTNFPVPKASIFIKKNTYSKIDTATADSKGVYKIKHIKEEDVYTIKISAAGYEDKEFKLKGYEFNSRKITRQIFLSKKIEITKPADKPIIVMGGVYSKLSNKDPLYVIDNIPCKVGTTPDINPDNIESISVLKGTQATAIYGSDASAGAIIITTKKKDVFIEDKNLQEVVVGSNCSGTVKRESILGQMTSGIIIKNSVTDTFKLIATKLTGSLKISPNPVQKGNAITVLLTVKQAGDYFIQVTNATGELLTQKQFYSSSKNNTQQIQTDLRWSSGIYFICLIDSNNNLVKTNRFIIQ
jgi:TonB-dependent SusC/RagA subfamily outer membrane receptor